MTSLSIQSVILTAHDQSSTRPFTFHLSISLHHSVSWSGLVPDLRPRSTRVFPALGFGISSKWGFSRGWVSLLLLLQLGMDIRPNSQSHSWMRCCHTGVPFSEPFPHQSRLVPGTARKQVSMAGFQQTTDNGLIDITFMVCRPQHLCS